MLGFGGEYWGKDTTLWRRRRKWEDNNQMQLQEVVCGVMDWVELIDEM